MTAQLRALGVAIVALLLASIATVAVRSGDAEPQAIDPTPTPTVTTPVDTPTPTPPTTRDPLATESPSPTGDPGSEPTDDPAPSPSPTSGRKSNEGPKDRLPPTGGPGAMWSLLLLVPAAVAVGVRKSARSRRAR